MESKRTYLKANELSLPETQYTISMNTYSPKSHYKFLMGLGRVFPNTPTQAKYFISKGICLDVLNSTDVKLLEQFLNKYGFEGKYRYTKSKTFARLQNNLDLHRAIKIAFGI